MVPGIQDLRTSSGPLSTPRVAKVAEPVEDSQEKLLAELPALNVEPLWPRMTRLNPPLPEPKAVPYLWKYEDIQPRLLRAGTLVTEKQAERRVLMLINPAMDAPCTTDTLYAGMQLVMPGETAPAHRHTAFACRFIIEGNGGFTAVHGKRITMHRGDFILTPTWNFHDHGNSSSATPMIWLDGLDLPQFQHFPVHFVQHYSEPRYPAKDAPTSTTLYPWAEVQAKLDQMPEAHATVRYTSQEPGQEGAEVSKIIGAQVERVDAGTTTELVRDTVSAVYHVIDGSGSSLVGSSTIVWKEGDTFAVPSWSGYSHTADELTYLYRFDDRPMISALGFYRNEKEAYLSWEQ